jgi:Flp pilus assembly pilin Flp
MSVSAALRRFVADTEGQDIIEYALLAAFISVVAYTVLVTIGTDVSTIYGGVVGATTAAAGAAAS